jgi:hypothetical protein
MQGHTRGENLGKVEFEPITECRKATRVYGSIGSRTIFTCIAVFGLSFLTALTSKYSSS